MKLIKIIFIFSIITSISCSSTRSSDKIANAKNPVVVNPTAGSAEKPISIYGLIKAEGGNVYVVTNWNSRSMVSYKVTGEKKTELEASRGKYASVSGILTEKKTWSGTIDVRKVVLIDENPNPQMERMNNLFRNKKDK